MYQCNLAILARPSKITPAKNNNPNRRDTLKPIQLVYSLLIALFSVAVMANADTPRGMTLEDLTKVKNVVSSAIAPNGKYIAFTRSLPRTPYKDEDGKAWVELYVTDAKGNERPFITGEVNIGKLHWSADSKKIYFVTKRNKDKFPALYAIAVDGGEAQKVYEHGNSIASYDIDQANQRVVFVAK